MTTKLKITLTNEQKEVMKVLLRDGLSEARHLDQWLKQFRGIENASNEAQKLVDLGLVDVHSRGAVNPQTKELVAFHKFMLSPQGKRVVKTL